MSRLEDQFIEDRRLRDAAKVVLIADVEHARSSFSAKGMADRVGSRIGDGAVDVFEQAKDKAGKNGGLIAGAIALLILWFGREPLMEALGRFIDKAEAKLEEAELETGDTSLADRHDNDDISKDEGEPSSPATPGDDDEQ